MTALLSAQVPEVKLPLPITCVLVELGLDISPSKWLLRAPLLTSTPSSDFSFPKEGEDDEDRSGRRKRVPAKSSSPECPTLAAATPEFDFLLLDCTGEWGERKVGSHLEETDRTSRSQPRHPYSFIFLALKTLTSSILSLPLKEKAHHPSTLN